MSQIKQIIETTLLESGIMHIRLNRPEQLNALSKEVLQQLSQIFNQVKQDQTIKALLISGQGKGFCAGADIKQLMPLTAQTGFEFAKLGQAVFSQLETLNKPSLAAIHGFAFGGGCELAMAATLRMATENTLFGQPEIKLGVIPGFGGTQRLARLIGKGRALEICLTGKRFSAKQALEWGFINEIVAENDLLAHAVALLNEIIAYSPIAMKSIMSTVHSGYDLSLAEALDLEAAHFGLCCASSDKKEGVTAFLEKRPAQFCGV